MFISSGYLNNSRLPYKDKSKPLIVGSCGTYRLKSKSKLPTWRPRGRLDYQLLYVASGKTIFYFNGEPKEVTAGHMILFQPRQEQHYEYFAKDTPQVYWVHFTGGNVKNILRHFDIPLDTPIFYCGTSAVYTHLFKEMIQELQNCPIGYQELLEMYLRQLFLQIQRCRLERKPIVSSQIHEEIEQARRYFQDHYNEPISIEEYAAKHGMSVSWFLKNFRQVTGRSPMQYILSLRINNAATLLETTDFNVTEISTIVGYDNPLYFSRLFKKQKGISPSDYRKERFAEKQG